jgi:hypothetical protein
VILDGCPPHLEDTDAVALHLPDHLLNMQLEQIGRLELMASAKHLSTERETTAPTLHQDSTVA